MNRIRKLREEARLTQDQLGKMLTCKKSTISKYERESVDLHTGVVIKLSRIFNVSTDYILGLSSVRQPINYINLLSDTTPSVLSDKYNANQLFCLSAEECRILQYYKRLSNENKDCIRGYMVQLFRDQPVEEHVKDET